MFPPWAPAFSRWSDKGDIDKASQWDCRRCIRHFVDKILEVLRHGILTLEPCRSVSLSEHKWHDNEIIHGDLTGCADLKPGWNGSLERRNIETHEFILQGQRQHAACWFQIASTSERWNSRDQGTWKTLRTPPHFFHPVRMGESIRL